MIVGFRLPRRRSLLTQVTLVGMFFLPPAYCQRATEGTPPPADPPAEAASASSRPESKRVFGIIPNYRTFPTLANSKPLTPRAKFGIATQDTFDRGSVALAAAFAGEGQWTNSNPSFGQGAKGYAHYFGTSFSDIAIGDFMTEAIYPILLRQDPRYFRRGTGTGWSRLGYAASRIFWTRKDSGASQFNFSEIVGNSTAVAISNAYYPDNRSASAAASRLVTQVGVDMLGNILKEFWPDVYRKLSKKHGQ